MRDLILVGASGLAREVMAMQQSAYRVIGVLDDDAGLHGHPIGGVDVLGGIDLAADLPGSIVVCVGSGAARRSIVGRLASLGVGGERYATLVDDSARLSANSLVGPGTIILAGSVLTA
ncbi:MAG TPA: acetyltransferase, partial [Diaminobutyricibacter sp.]